jgi:hypothetical protein
MKRFLLVRWYTYFNTCTKYLILVFFIIIACCNRTNPVKQQKTADWDYENANYQYKLYQAEINLANGQKPYLVIDFQLDRVMLKLKGAIVWDYPLTFIETDSSEIVEFIKSFRGVKNNIVRNIKNKYLFEVIYKTSDSVLQIVSEAVKIKPELLQREIPEQFQITWSSELKLVVRTDIIGKPLSRIHNAFVRITDALDSPLGDKIIKLKMEPLAALTLYRAAEKGMPTLIIP